MLDSEIIMYLAQEVSTGASNGGRMSNNAVQSGVMNNVFPHVSRAERTNGAVLHRKVFFKAANDADETLLSALGWAERVVNAADWVVAFLGTQTNTQGDLTGNERKYGTALLKTDIVAGAQTFTVTVKDASLASGTDAIFKDGGTIRLSDKATPSSATGNEEFLTINGAPVVNGLDVTITVDQVIAASYAAATPTHVSSYPVVGDVKCSVTNFAVTAAGSGAYDSGSYPVAPDNIGTVEDHVTLTFTDTTNFAAVGSSGINYGAGSTAADFAPSNAAFAKPYFTLESAGFSGVWQAGDTIEFDIHPASFALWLRRTVPAGCPSLANNKVTVVAVGESQT